MTSTSQRVLSQRVLAGALALAVAACAESTAPGRSSALLSDAFSTLPVGFSSVTSSFATSSDAGMAWVPGGPGGPGGGRHGDGPGFGDMMGAGMRDEFIGGAGFGPGFGRGPFGDAGLIGVCTFSAQTGRITCDPITAGGLTFVRSAAYSDAAGHAQSALDATTNTINTRNSVSGTITYGPGMGRGYRLSRDLTRTDSILSATTTVQNASDRTTSGLAAGSTQRTVNGTSAGHETTTGTTTAGAFTVSRVVGDTTTGLVIPVKTSGIAYPTAGTVIRSMQATATLPGQAAKSASRREVVTYDGSAAAKVVITQDGVTKSCTMPLPRGRLACA